MKYKYITDKDLNNQLKQYLVEQIEAGDEDVVEGAERTALAKMRSKLSNRYIIDEVFFKLPEDWEQSSTYAVDDEVCHEDNFYRAIVTSTDVEPGTDEDIWEPYDRRNPLLVGYCRDLVIYDLYCRINPRKIADIARERYAEAMEWLESVRLGEDSPDLPLKELGTNNIHYGSNEPRDYYW